MPCISRTPKASGLSYVEIRPMPYFRCPDMQELFDLPDQYEAMLEKGIGLTGNDKSFFVRGRLDLICREIKQRISPASILDFGCGTGETTAEWKQRFPASRVWGTDPAIPALRWAEAHNGGKDILFQPLEEIKNQTFDLVYLNCVLHHVPPKERKPVCEVLRSLVKNEGEVWIFENNPANPGTQYAMWANPFDKGVKKIWPSELQKLAEEAGFQIISRHFIFYFPQWLSWFRPLERSLEKFPLGGQYGFRLKPV